MMELDDIVARLLHGENDALAGLPIEPVHVQAARRQLYYAADFAGWVRQSKMNAATIQEVLVPEQLWSLARTPKQPAFDSRNVVTRDKMRALLFVALAHRPWATIARLMTSLGTAAETLEHYRAAHKARKGA